MSKMRKEYDPNKVKRRKRKPIVYIICEGKETETLYFKHFRSRNCLVDIIPIPSKHKAAEHLVKHAKSLISHVLTCPAMYHSIMHRIFYFMI